MPLPPRLSAAARALDAWLSRYPGRLIYRVTLAAVILATCAVLLVRTTPRYEYRQQEGGYGWWVKIDRLGLEPPVRGRIGPNGFVVAAQ